MNGIVVHRALGPDRVPTVPNAMDDEMVDPVFGYNPALWTLHNTGTGTVHADPIGGLCFDLKDDSKWVWLEQVMGAGAAYDFRAKVAIGAQATDTNVYLGLAIAVSSDGSPYYWHTYEIGWNGGQAFFLTDVATSVGGGFPDNTRTNISFTQSGQPQARPQGWWYLRITSPGGVSNATFWVSENGLTWQKLGADNLPGTPDRVRLQAYFHGTSNPAPFYVQWFRRFV